MAVDEMEVNRTKSWLVKRDREKYVITITYFLNLTCAVDTVKSTHIRSHDFLKLRLGSSS